ncbi:MAG: SLC13 family permease [Acidobacteria bacterium]|nr:SLC13 family permease [Acidobacteriota bacterium]
MLSGILEPEARALGFASPATVTVACMFVLSAGLQATGIVEFLASRLLRYGPRSERGLLAMLAVVVGPISAFINNTAAVAIFMPVALRACQGRRISPSRILMPLAFFAILGGMCTLVGTSTNILVATLAVEHGQPPFGVFEFSRLGVIIFVMGAIYLVVATPKLIPERISPSSADTTGYELGRFLIELVVPSGTKLVGVTLRDARLAETHDLEVLGLVRDGVMDELPSPDIAMREGDLLLVKMSAERLPRLQAATGLQPRPGHRAGEAQLLSPGSVLVAVVIAPNSFLEGRTLKEVNFRRRYGATCVAIRRRGEDIVEKVGRIRIGVGDELLVLAHRYDIELLSRQSDFIFLQELEAPLASPWRAALAASIVFAVIALAAANLYPIVATAVAGAVLLVLTRCLTVQKAYAAIEWRIIAVLGGLIPLGAALDTTGGADKVVRALLWLVGDTGPTAVLGVLFFVTYALTGFMSNTATAALMVPLAVSASTKLGVDARPFLIAIAFAASAAFYTPVGYQTNMLVYGPGGYRFSDYMRLGGPLNILYWFVGVLLIPLLFPF